MGLLATCPKCGTTIAKGTTCPSCFHGENVAAPQSTSIIEEYARRQSVHKRNYTIFMVSALCLGLTTLLLIGAVFMVTKGRRAAYAMTPGTPKPPAISMEDPGPPLPGPLDPDDPDDPDNPNAMPAMPDDESEDDELQAVELSPDDFDLTYLVTWFAIIGGLTVAEGGLTYFVIKCRKWWPIDLNCPGCEVRLDELGGKPDRCPSCMARLRSSFHFAPACLAVSVALPARGSTMFPPFDGIILGTGHNALVLQAYLCRAGLKVLSVDRLDRPGGGLTTEPNPRLPGFLHNTHSFFHRAISTMPWYRDLELERHGARYIEPELNVVMILPDGRALEWWTDLDKTVASFAEFSARDAAALRRWSDEFRPIVEEILLPEAKAPPLPPDQRQAKLAQTPLGRRLLEVSAWSPLEFVAREFENDVIRAGLLFFNGLREIDLRQKGFGHAIPALLASRHKAQMCLGGSVRLAEALVQDIREHGGDVRTGVELKGILTQQGKAVGVELTGSERLAARFVASGLNPQQTFVQLLDADATSPPVRQQAEGFQYNLLAPLFALNLALKEPPRYRAAEKRPELERAFMVILGLERFDQFPDIVACHERGEIPPTVMWGCTPTVFDPSQAPAGQHVAFMWEKLPYALAGDPQSWDRAKEGHGKALLDLWTRYAPNLREAVLDWFVRSPLDTERLLPNMRQGDLLVGSFANGQVGYHRPFAGAGAYRTPVTGLYLCGGSTHPGGNITGLCGYNAAQVIAADLGVQVAINDPGSARQP